MDDPAIRAYLKSLSRELRSRGIADPDILEEIGSHLLESAEQGLNRGLDPQAASAQALAQFGSPKTIAVQFERERNTRMKKLLFAVALSLGLLIAYVDSRPTWDDTGITAMAVLATCGLLGLLSPKRPWVWALAVGIWIPLVAILTHHNFGALLALIFAFLGAYAGMAFRLVVQKAFHPA